MGEALSVRDFWALSSSFPASLRDGSYPMANLHGGRSK